MSAADLEALRNERDTLREQLQMTHAQVAEVARMLDPEVCPDTWGLRDAAQKMKTERDALRAVCMSARSVLADDDSTAAMNVVDRINRALRGES